VDAGDRGRTARPGQWYLHLSDSKQPDLDWTNPDVVEEFESILRFWLDRGVDGFRIDVAHGLAKDPEMPDLQGDWATGGPAGRRPPALGPRRGARGLPRLATGHRTPMPATACSSVRSGCRRPSGWPATCAATSCTRLQLHLPARLVGRQSLHTAIDDSIDALSAVGAPADLGAQQPRRRAARTRYGGGAAGVRRQGRDAADPRLPGGAYIYQGRGAGPAGGHRPAGAAAPGSRVRPGRTARTGLRDGLPGDRSRGRATRLRSASGPAPASPGCHSPPTGRR
jgi:alpha-glucosidase